MPLISPLTNINKLKNTKALYKIKLMYYEVGITILAQLSEQFPND